MKKETVKDLEKKAALLDKERAEIQNKIKQIQESNKPKSIMDKVKTIEDVFRIAKLSPQEKAIVNYNGKSKRLLFSKHFLILSLISEVLNEGWTPKEGDNRYYAWFYISSGFAFFSTYYDRSSAVAASASRLCFKNSDLAEYAARTFLSQYKDAIL